MAEEMDVFNLRLLFICFRHQQQGSKTVKDKDRPTTDQILSHLDHMRRTCRNISCEFLLV